MCWTSTAARLAIESGKSGTVSGHAYKTGLTPDSVTHSWYQISFGGFTAAPRFLAMLQSYDDPDNCHLRYGRTTLRASGVQVMIEEDKTQDPYTSHGTEVVGYVAIQGSGSLEGRPVGMTRFMYDGDGNRVLQVKPDGSRRAFVGLHYEVWQPGPPPPAPEDLYAVYHDGGGESYVGLGWKPTTAEEGSTFSVYRSATTPVPLDAGHRIASGLTSGSYPDFNGQLGDYYVVTAVNQYGESGPSNTAQAQKVGITGGEEDAGSIVASGGQAPNDGERSAVGGTEVLSREEILKYYFLGGRRVAMRRDGVVYYFHTDHLGSTSAMSDGAGNAYGDPVRYLPFGEVRSGDLGALPTDHGFTGHKHEADHLGLIFMQARYYVAELGRFVSPDILIPDPADPQSYNRYAYVLNNPLTYVDPDGHRVRLPFYVDILNAVKDRLTMWSPFAGGVVAAPQAAAPTSSDITDWLIEQMLINASEGASVLREYYRSPNPVEVAGAIQAWTSLVRTGGAWDFKEGILDSELVFGDEKLIVLGGRHISYQAAANVHFGFVGRAATFESGFLQLGAGLAHINDNGLVLGNLPYYGDDAFDNWCIRFGVYLHGLYGGWRLDQLTPEVFSNALEEFITKYGEPPEL